MKLIVKINELLWRNKFLFYLIILMNFIDHTFVNILYGLFVDIFYITFEIFQTITRNRIKNIENYDTYEAQIYTGLRNGVKKIACTSIFKLKPIYINPINKFPLVRLSPRRRRHPYRFNASDSAEQEINETKTNRM